MRAAFSAADFVALPAVEPPVLGRTVAQAQAMGRPVVTTDIGVLPEHVVAPPRLPEEVRTGFIARAGDAVDFAASDIHRVTHGGGGPAITINAYSPPLWRMGAYETTASGALQRHSISYAEELRPLGLVVG
jgi:hypothetical protein